ncbi:MAG: hypothetical protein AAGF92_15975 [Myxococcota bacterium]
MRIASILIALCLISATTAGAQDAQAPSSSVVSDTPAAEGTAPAAAPTSPQCEPIQKGGPIAGIVVASVFWYVLPMSIPVWITQAKKLKRLKKKEYEQMQRGCSYSP